MLAALVAASAFASAAPALHVDSCQTVSGGIVPARNEVGLAVRFENTSDRVYRSIVWRAKYGDGYIDFTDDGTFSSNVRIDNFLLYQASKPRFSIGNALLGLMVRSDNAPSPWITPNQFDDYAGTDEPENCSIVSAVDQDGATWVNPGIALPHAHIPAAASFGLPGVSTTPLPASAGGVSIRDCTYGFYQSGWMLVQFTNSAERVARRIVFRASYRNSGIDFADAGTFTAGVTVKHMLKAPVPNGEHLPMYESFDEPAACSVVSIDYADGTSWQNPAVTLTPGPFATPVPDALDLGNERANVWTRAGQVHGLPPSPSAEPSSSPSP